MAEQQKLKGKEVFRTYFVTSEVDPKSHTCRECSVAIKQDLAKGYSNLISHVTTLHKDDCFERIRVASGVANGPMDTFVRKSTEKAKNIYGWMDWIVRENLPLLCCENKNYRKRSNLGVLTTKTLKKYMQLMKRNIFEIIKKRAPPTYGLIIDGWSTGSQHFFAIFITWTNETSDFVEEYLIFFGVSEDVDEHTEFEDIDDDLKKFGFTAADWFDIICLALNEVFGNITEDTRINIDNFAEIVEFISADNCSTNTKLCNDSGVPMKGCDSHRLNLAVLEMLGPEERKNRAGAVVQQASVMQALTLKLDRCMGNLKTLKNSSLLRTKTPLRAERRNKTRWSSLYKMIKKWSKIKDKVAAIETWGDDMLDLIPDAAENRKLSEYLQKLGHFESVSKKLQGSGENRMTVFKAREILDVLIRDHGDEFQLTAIKRDAAIIQNKHFENGIFKIQAGLESQMDGREKNAVKIFLKTPAGVVPAQPVPDEDEDYATRALRIAEDQKRRRISASKYRSTNHVSPTTNVVERANSQAKLIMADRRDSMAPETLNMLMILKLNASLWPNESSIQEILDSDDFQDPELEADSEEDDDA